MKLFRRNRCYNGGGLHKFEARYTEKSEPVDISLDINYIPYFKIPDILKQNAKREKTYECDVCVWCGKVVKNGE